MKNYLIKSLFEINDPNWGISNRSSEIDLYKNYQQMHDISVASFEKHLAGNWELKVLSGKVNTIHEAFEKTFWAIHDLWHSEPCNIFYTDADTIAIDSVDPWDQFDQFMMFNFTDPKTFIKFNKWRKRFMDFFDDGICYFPASMLETTWDIGTTIAKDWDHTNYHTKKIICNSMLWEQGLSLMAAKHPDLAYQAMWMPNLSSIKIHNLFNEIDIENAKIVHTHARKDSASKLEYMKTLTN